MNAKIILKTKKDQSLRRFHPWVFSGAIKKTEGNLFEGAVVDVYSNNDHFLGRGHYQSGSIAVKVVDFEGIDFDREFWKSRIQTAWDLRLQLGLLREDNNVFRLIHAEGDRLPGLIADYYNGTIVLQTPSIGMHYMKEELCSIFKEVLGDHLTAVYDKSATSIPKEAKITIENGYVYGEGDGKTTVLENGHKFEIDWVNGQKTGFFIDQRENRELLAQYCKGKKVLNTFCYSGGFSIYALAAGASEVHSLDSSVKALDLVTRNLDINGMNDARHKNIKADAVDYVKELGDEYDIIILDPPAFAKHQSARHKAVQGYKRLNANAIRQIKPGGLLMTFSCSQAVDKYLFNHTLAASAIHVGRPIKMLHQLHQPADHPVQLFHPEGEYLKGLVLQVD